MIPAGWHEAKIREVAKIDVGRDLVEERFSRTISDTHHFPIYSNTVEQHGHYGFYDFPEYSAESVTVVGRGIGLGTAFARTKPFGAIGRLLVLSPKNGSFDVGYLADYLNHGFQIHYESGGIPQLPGKTLGNYSILLPPLTEQRRIAEILATWDRAIETVQALIANARAQKKALMQSLLTGKHRLPGFAGEWTTKTINDVVEITTGKSKSEFIDPNGKYLIIDMGSVTRTGGLVSQKPTNNSEDVLGLGDLIMPKDDIGGGNIIGRVAKIDRKETYVLGDHVYLLRSKAQFSPDFLQYVINSHPVNKALRRKANGTAQLGLGKADVQKTSIRVPEHAEQCAIAAILMLADSDLLKLGDQLTALRQEKSALMQQLLNGKRRVTITEKEAA